MGLSVYLTNGDGGGAGFRNLFEKSHYFNFSILLKFKNAFSYWLCEHYRKHHKPNATTYL